MKLKLFFRLTIAFFSVIVLSATLLPVHALVVPDEFAFYIAGWEGANSGAILKGYGVGNNLKVGTSGETGNHVWYVDANGGGYLIQDGSRSYCVNMHRILQSGIYYPCTGYYYENATGGRDQRVQLIQYNNYTVIRLLNPIVGGNWYMMADYSTVVPSSDVIWYTDSSLVKAHWV